VQISASSAHDRDNRRAVKRCYSSWKKVARGAFSERGYVSGGKKRGFRRLPWRVAMLERTHA
jgi:hypothetical protein